jgi:hypothetical protein
MMTNLTKVLGLLVLVSVLTGQAAHAGAMFSVYGSGVLPQTVSLGGGVDVKGKVGFGGGAMIEGMLNPTIGAELGAMYLARQFTLEAGGVSADFPSVASIFVPAGLRVHANRYLSIEGGGFFDYSLETGNDINYGVQGGLRLSIPMGASSSLFFEGRYDLGLKDFSGTKRSDLVLALVGLTFGSHR